MRSLGGQSSGNVSCFRMNPRNLHTKPTSIKFGFSFKLAFVAQRTSFEAKEETQEMEGASGHLLYAWEGFLPVAFSPVSSDVSRESGAGCGREAGDRMASPLFSAANACPRSPMAYMGSLS